MYETAGDPRLSLYMQLVRGAEKNNVQEGVNAVINMNTDQAMNDIAVMAFQTRDVRGGKGERQLFYTMLQAMEAYDQELAEKLLKLIPQYGSWDDMFTIANGMIPSLKGAVLLKAAEQVEKDEKNLSVGESISLVSKWAPREGKAFTALASEFARLLTGNPKVKHSQIMSVYRKRMVRLNAALKTVETYECANRWDEIDPARVPGRARHIKMAAYMNEKGKKNGKELRHPENEKRMSCRQHFQEFFQKAAKGEVKITGVDTLYPHELVERASESLQTATDDDKNSINAVWDGMVAKASQGGGLGRSTVMCDFSGSMCGTPYWVSLAMGILISSVTTPAFKNRFMSFDSVPTWHTFQENEKTLFEKLESINRNHGIGHGTSTDFQKALDLILKTLKESNCQPGDEPENLIVVTDMGWDAASGSEGFSSYEYVVKTTPWQTHLEMAQEAFRAGGWKVPRIVVWNVSASYSMDFQAQADTEGVLMLAGWSPSLFKVLCEEGPKLQNPYDALRAQLDDKRYDPVRAVVSEWLEGGWRT